MASTNNDEIISKASPHTIKKFELIEEYIKTWAQKLMMNQYCQGLVFIDCMCNSGVYHNDAGEEVIGTPLRVANILRDVSGQYPRKQIMIFYNDMNESKVALLRSRLPKNKSNFTIATSVGDGNELLKTLAPKLDRNKNIHFFLLYDPYDASIDWEALFPYFRHWGEVLLNHMVSDPIRAISQVKSEKAKQKYMDTYMIDGLEKLLPFGSDRNAYEKRIESIITALRGNQKRDYYIASFPFFNSRNTVVYNLVHCTGNSIGFNLFKKTAWKTFGDKSSLKDRHGQENQLVLCLSGEADVMTTVDENCYNLNDVAFYLQSYFRGKQNISFDEMWSVLAEHPVFPADGYRPQLRAILKDCHGATITKSTISFRNGG